jgi:hypothetical protein
MGGSSRRNGRSPPYWTDPWGRPVLGQTDRVVTVR